MLENLTLFQMAKKRLDWISQRQTVLAENIANANTPGYRSKDLEPLSFKKQLQASGLQMAATNPAHFTTEPAKPGWDVETVRKPFETSPDKNDVVLEEQMAKLGEAKSAYELAAGLISKHARMIKTAVGRGGGG